jgi:signal transduction histidine kinase
VIVYAWLRIGNRAEASSRIPTAAYIVIVFTSVEALAGCIMWLAAARYVPRSHWDAALEVLVSGAAFLLLWGARRSAFDQWILVVLISSVMGTIVTSIIPNFSRTSFLDVYHGFNVGFYAGRVFSAVSSTLVLAALIAETATLYAEVARVNALTITVSVSQTLSSEIALPNLIKRLMTVVLQYSGADRGLLILPRQNDYVVEAEARVQGKGVSLNTDAPDSPPLPDLIIRYVSSTQTPAILDDAAKANRFSEDPYLGLHAPRSILCLPLVRQGVLGGLIYLENSQAPKIFTSERVRLLELLASQAAISLENARLYADLEIQVGLLQQLPVSAWTLKPDGTPDFVNEVWLEFAGQTLDFVRSNPEAWMTAVHPEDREMAAKSFWEGVRSGQGFAFETRTLRAKDSTYRRHLQQAVVLRDTEGRVLRFVGTTMDIDDQRHAEETLRQAQSDLARINRVTMMGELAASVAHDVSQPISGAVLNAGVCLRKLGYDQPNLDEVRLAASRMLRDAQRAAEIVKRIRLQFEKRAPNRELTDVNEIIRETVALLRGEAIRYNISVQTELSADLPLILGDRVQLQQVAMNLIVNSIEAMKDVDGKREISIKSQQCENGQILVAFCDTGTGFPPEMAEQIFDSFFTTKPHGTGMGLRICRSIIESHKGRMWAESAAGRGATFYLNLPITIPDQMTNQAQVRHKNHDFSVTS